VLRTRRGGIALRLSFDCRPTPAVGARFDDSGLRGEMAAGARLVTALGPARRESGRASETSSGRWVEGEGVSMLRPVRAGRDLTRDSHSTVALQPLWVRASMTVICAPG
jgi:hypothetical protein